MTDFCLPGVTIHGCSPLAGALQAPRTAAVNSEEFGIIANFTVILEWLCPSLHACTQQKIHRNINLVSLLACMYYHMTAFSKAG